MDTTKVPRSRTRGPRTTTTVLALLLIVCLVESVTGGCMRYGHSCWGAHGKRSGHAPVAAPDWDLTKILRHIAANSEMNRDRRVSASNEEIRAKYQMDEPANEQQMLSDFWPAKAFRRSENEISPVESAVEERPMVDDYILSKIKLWQNMRESSQED